MEAALPAESTDSSNGPVAPGDQTEVQKPDDDGVQEPNKPDNYKCRRCRKSFLTGPALCGHQNAHRLTKLDPNRDISPVLAAVLSNPLPGDEDLDLFCNKPGPSNDNDKEKEKVSKKEKEKEKVSKKKQKQPASTSAPGNESPRFHPYQRRRGKKKKEPLIVENQDMNDLLLLEETGSSDDNPNVRPMEEVLEVLPIDEQIIQKDGDDAQPKYHYHPFEERVVQPEPEPETPAPVYNSEVVRPQQSPQRVTLDLFGEWAPLSGFGEELGTSYRRDSAGDDALEIGSRRPRSSAPLDLELKLGFGPGY